MKIQEMFTTVVTHLLTQKKRAINPKTKDCAYLSEDGCKCAGGCLIPPDTYTPKMEGIGVYGLAFFHDLASTSENYNSFMLVLSRLQEIHDKNLVEEWKDRCQDLAVVAHLEMPEGF